MNPTTDLDLSKLDWSSLTFPGWKGRKVKVACALVGNFAYIEADGFMPIASQCREVPGWWDIRRCTIDEHRMILEMCEKVEWFIEAERAKAGGK